MMFVDSNGLNTLLDKHKEEFVARYKAYIEELSQGNDRVKEFMSSKDRVLLTVLSKFLKDHKHEMNLPLVDRIDAAKRLLPYAKETLKSYI